MSIPVRLLVLSLALGAFGLPAAAAQPVFRCGKTYTNVPAGERPPQAGDCRLVDVDPASAPHHDKLALDGSRQITVPVGQNGQFWVRGSINGIPVTFMVVRNASFNAGVAVTEAFAARASLHGGAPTFVKTSGGLIDGRRLDKVRVAIGPLKVPQATVVVGPLPEKGADALLGPDLLSLFDVTASDSEMTIVAK